MLEFLNIFWKKKPEITVTLEVNTPKYEVRSEWVYTPPPPAKIPDNACCPYCWVVFDKPPAKKKKCVDCGGHIYVRTSEDRVKLYLTDIQVEFHDRLRLVSQWSQSMEISWFQWLSEEEKEKSVKDDKYFASLVEQKLMNETRKALKNIDFFNAYLAQRYLHEFYENRDGYNGCYLMNSDRFRESWEKQLQKESDDMFKS